MTNPLRNLLLITTAALTPLAYADVYDPATNRLKIESVWVGDTEYRGVVITVGQVISVESEKGPSPIADTCSISHFSVSAFNAIQEGMSLSQVKSIMGCEFNPARTQRGSNYVNHIWSLAGTMTWVQVWFDVTGTTVTRLYPDPVIPFKYSNGI